MHVGILVSFFCPYVPTHEVRKRKRWRQRGFKMGIVWVTEASCYLVSGQRCFPVQIIPQQSVVPFISCTGGYVQEKNTGWMDHWFDPGSSFHWTARMRLSLWWCFEISSCFNKPCGCYRCQKPFNSYAKGFFLASIALHQSRSTCGTWISISMMQKFRRISHGWLAFTVSQITSRGEA